MKKSVVDTQCLACLELLGDFWTLRIIDALASGEMRFCTLQRSVGNVNPVTLTNRLRKLEKTGLLSRTEDTVDKVSVSYSLTGLGQDALDVIKAMSKFSQKLTT